jgi:hypothetical protein
MYGGSYVDVHDNEVVNLNIEKAVIKRDFESSRLQDFEITGQQDDEAKERAAVLTENAEFMAIMQKAVEAGFCKQDGWQYRWKVKVEAAYFASLANERFNLSKRKINGKTPAVTWIPFEALFGLNDLRTAFNGYKQCKTALVRECEIDKLFA